MNLYLYLYFLLSIEWMILHAMGKIIMDQTRHLLMWAPLVAILVFYTLKNIKFNKVVLVTLSVMLTVLALYNNVLLVNSKKSTMDLNTINKYPQKVVFCYSFTLEPLIGLKNKEVYNIDVNSFNKNVFKNNLPKEALLISQDRAISEYFKIKNLNNFSMKFLHKYNIETIKEFKTNTYFTYNNYPISSTQNGLFLYRLTLKDK